MNKTLFLCLLFSVVLFSCTKKSDVSPRQTNGKINTISVIVDDQLWNGEIGDSIRNKFASPVVGLPQEEPLFTINQYPIKLLEGFATDSRAIIIVKKEAINKFEINKNEYASPQNVFHISGKTGAEIIAILEKNTPKIIQIIHDAEIAESQRIIKQSLLNPKIIANKFHISLSVPSGYEYMLHKSRFIWMKKEIISGNTSLLIYQLPLDYLKKDPSLIASIVKMRDSIGKYIKGTEPNTYMISETGYTPYFFKSKIDNRLAYETRGTWQLQNDYMSGPFINYTIVDTTNHRLLVLEGFCYSPSKEKRDVMHELEAIIHSVHLLKNNTFTPHKK